MCKHNDDDYDCLDCCFEMGANDAIDDLACDPPYKNFDQCDAYRDGWFSMIEE